MSTETELTIRLIDGTEEEQRAFNEEPPFDDGGNPRVRQVKTPTADAPAISNQGDGTKAFEDSSSQSLLSRLRDALQSVADALAPEAVRQPIERLIDALTFHHPREKPTSQTPDTKAPSLSRKNTSTPRVSDVGKDLSAKKRDSFRSLASDALSAIGRKSRFVQSVASRFQKARSETKRVLGLATKTKVGQSIAKGVRSLVPMGRTATMTASTAAAGTATAGAAGAGGASTAAAAAPALANPVGITVAAAVAAFAAATIAVKKFSDVMSEEADRLEDLSPEVALARAIKDMNTQINMLDRANKIGKELGGLESAKSALSDQTQQLWTEMLERLSRFAPLLEKGVEGVAYVVGEIRMGLQMLEVMEKQLGVVVANLTVLNDKDDAPAAAALQTAWDDAVKLRQELNNMWNNKNPDEMIGVIDPMLQSVMDAQLDSGGNLVRNKP